MFASSFVALAPGSRAASLFLLAFACILAGCGGGSSSSSSGGSQPTISTITVSPASPSIAVGATQQFTATAKDSSGNTISGVTFTWSSNTTSVATINSSGLATGVAPGTTQITASAGGVTSSPDTLTVTAPVVASITVSPSSPSIAVGATQQFTATAKDGSGNTISGVTFTWSSNNTSVATIDGNGLATALLAGSTQITASAAPHRYARLHRILHHRHRARPRDLRRWQSGNRLHHRLERSAQRCPLFYHFFQPNPLHARRLRHFRCHRRNRWLRQLHAFVHSARDLNRRHQRHSYRLLDPRQLFRRYREFHRASRRRNRRHRESGHCHCLQRWRRQSRRSSFPRWRRLRLPGQRRRHHLRHSHPRSDDHRHHHHRNHRHPLHTSRLDLYSSRIPSQPALRPPHDPGRLEIQQCCRGLLQPVPSRDATGQSQD